MTLRELTGKESPRIAATGENGMTMTRTYVVSDATNPVDVLALLPAYGSADAELASMLVDAVRLEPYEGAVRVVVEYKQAAARWWGNMGLPYLNAAGEEWTFSIEAQQEHITSVRDSSYAAHYPAASELAVGNAIGKSGDSVEGVDVYRPRMSMRCARSYDSIALTGLDTVLALTGMVNSDPWMGFAAGTVLFLGAEIAWLKEGQVKVSYSFLVGAWQLAQSITLVDGSTVEVDIPPWDYLWYVHTKKAVGSGDTADAQPGIQSVHIAQVYDRGNLAALGLLGPPVVFA
jgi:hypothetical protein